MGENASERFTKVLSQLYDRIYNYCDKQIKNELTLGACIVTPKYASVPKPTQAVQAELERRTATYFEQTEAVGYCFRYSSIPLNPRKNPQATTQSISVDDYQMSLNLPRFDDEWEQIILARSLIYCPVDYEQHGWSDWFELQREAIRLTPLLHQSLKEIQTKFQIEITLTFPAKPIFQSFISEYALIDRNYSEMTKQEKKEENINKSNKDENIAFRYRLAIDAVRSAKTLKDLYIIARKKAISTRNSKLKSLFWMFINKVEANLVMSTNLSDKDKQSLISQLRGSKEKSSREKYTAKRPALCISDLECGQMLCLLREEFLASKTKNKAIAETILFILIAQHAAFSGLPLKEKDILSIQMNDINQQDLTIRIKNQEINITAGLNEILLAWTGDGERKNKRLLFQNLTYDNLEDIISKCSAKFYGPSHKLLPKDFLEKVHVIAGVRISIEMRRQITEQEELVKASPYRINPHEIKKQIKQVFL